MSIICMTLLFSVVMMGDSYASTTVFGAAKEKLVELFQNTKMVIFLIGGFGLVALAFQAIFGKIKWAWFAALAFGLALVAAAGAIINYAANSDSAAGAKFSDSLGTNSYGGFGIDKD